MRWVGILIGLTLCVPSTGWAAKGHINGRPSGRPSLIVTSRLKGRKAAVIRARSVAAGRRARLRTARQLAKSRRERAYKGIR